MSRLREHKVVAKDQLLALGVTDWRIAGVLPWEEAGFILLEREVDPAEHLLAPPNEESRGCLKAGPGRGDCLHFVGLPEEFNRHTTDVYGVPNGWCIVCWLQVRADQTKIDALETVVAFVEQQCSGPEGLAVRKFCENWIDDLRQELRGSK
jgi:hypothetical protein